MKLNRVIISGGGTGGHIFPALAIADAIKVLNPDAEILFVGAKGRMEMEKIPQAGYSIKGLDITGIKRSLSLSNIMFPFRLIKSIWTARSIVQQFNPQVVVGTGGFASGPTLYAASLLGIPTVIQEQNSIPGITNKWLSKKAVKICVAYPGLNQFFPSEKIVVTGNPVRNTIENNQLTREEGAKALGVSANKKIVFIYGGSQGALAINRGVVNALSVWADQDIQVIWQTGKSFFDEAQKAVSTNHFNYCKVFDFLDNMPAAYSCADLVVCRAGAISVSEICISGLPSVLVPLPTAAEDHQTKNAEALVAADAAVLLSNAEAPNNMGKIVVELLSNVERLNALSIGAKKMAVRDSAQKIVNQLIQIIK